MTKKNIDHSGRCAFCGTDVLQGFTTCTGCGATWRRGMEIGEAIAACLIVGPFAGIFFGLLAGSATNSYISALIVGLIVLVIFETAFLKKYRKFMWFRQEN